MKGKVGKGIVGKGEVGKGKRRESKIHFTSKEIIVFYNNKLSYENATAAN